MSKSIKDLTEDLVNKELIKVADKYPDYIYNANRDTVTCYYNRSIHDGNPDITGCIFGMVFQNLGVPQDSKELDIMASIRVLWGKYHDVCNIELLEVWNKAQALQDGGEPWGEAIKPLKEYLDNQEK